MLEPGETIEQCIARELLEETGYTIKAVLGDSVPLVQTFWDPWKSFEVCPVLTQSGITAVVEIDGDAPENQNPVQQLDGDENITIEIIEDFGSKSVQDLIKHFQERGVELSANISGFLSGVAVSAMLNPKQSV